MSTFALIAFALTPTAVALDCAPTAMGSALPADGAADVPVNARPAVTIYGDGTRVTFELEVDGAPIPDATFEALTAGDPQVWRLAGDVPLAPDAEVVVRAVDEGWDGEPFSLGEVAFRTGDHSDSEPPAPLDAVEADHHSSEGDWGPEHRYTLEVAGGDDPSGTGFLVELAADGDFDAALRRVRLDRPVEISHGLCTFDDAAELDPETTWIRVTPMDAAGNLGDATVSGPVDDEMVCGTRCSAVPLASFGAWGALLALAGVVRRRR